MAGKKKDHTDKKEMLKSRITYIRESARNMMDIMREGRLSSPSPSPFLVVHQDPYYKLRHYQIPESAAAEPRDPKLTLLLVPPLMVSTEVYDISPELSSIRHLVNMGVDLWVMDFGSPSHIEGAMERTLEGHVMAVDRAIDQVIERAGQEPHLGGYSQGGMFSYQAAAYRKSRGIRSVITFGSPVDLQRSFGKLNPRLAQALFKNIGLAVSGPLKALKGVPPQLIASFFRLLSVEKEVEATKQFFRLLGNREALERREHTRRYMTGEGFVAYPGPALRDLFDQAIVKNRLTRGGLVIGGQSVSFSEIRVPVLYFVGGRDDIGKPAAVRAIRDAAVNADLHEVEIQAGHFGLVVGGKAGRLTWPTVVQWMAWLQGAADKPNLDPENLAEEQAEALTDKNNEISSVYDRAGDLIDNLWTWLDDASYEVAEVMDMLRWQLPRYARIRSLRDHSRVSIAKVLGDQAQAIPKAPFFLWRGQVFSYREVNNWVNLMTRAMVGVGIRRGEHIGVFMDSNPNYLMVVAGSSRLGAVSVLLNTEIRGDSLVQALHAGQVDRIITDSGNLPALLEAEIAVPIYCYRKSADGLPQGIEVLTVDPEADTRLDDLALPLNPGRAKDVGLLIYTSGTTGLPKAVKITNHRWAMTSLSTAATGSITACDTIYSCLPMYHSTGMLVAIGGALVGGARLALTRRFSVHSFWDEVRQYGVTVVPYVGEMCRYLVNMPPSPKDRRHSVRLFAGNGMRKDIWEDLVKRFNPGQVIEFYASTEGNVILVNSSGKKIGSVGRPLVDDNDIRLVRFKEDSGTLEVDKKGQLIDCKANEPGLLISRIDPKHPFIRFDGYLDSDETHKKVLRNVSRPGDAWFDTGDILSRDREGDYWFVDRIGETFRWKGVNVSTSQVESVVSRLPFVLVSAVYGIRFEGREGRAGVAAIELVPGMAFDGERLFKQVCDHLPGPARPRVIRVVEQIETTRTMKFIKSRLREEGVNPAKVAGTVYRYAPKDKSYVAVEAADFPFTVD